MCFCVFFFALHFKIESKTVFSRNFFSLFQYHFFFLLLLLVLVARNSYVVASYLHCIEYIEMALLVYCVHFSSDSVLFSVLFCFLVYHNSDSSFHSFTFFFFCFVHCDSVMQTEWNEDNSNGSPCWTQNGKKWKFFFSFSFKEWNFPF